VYLDHLGGDHGSHLDLRPWIREAGYAYFFGLVGVASAVAVSASVLFFAVVAIATLPGAVLFAIGRRL
jgi:hypothetical protein